MGWPEFEQLLHGDSAPRAVDWDRAGFNARYPLLEIGPGRGATTIAMAKAFPGSQIIAVEPDDEYRVLLSANLAAAEVDDRVTLAPCPIRDAVLPDRLGGVTCFGVLYFLSPDERERLWEQLARHLPTGGLVITEDGDGPTTVESVPPSRVMEKTIQDTRHERWFGSETTRTGEALLLNRVRTFRDGKLLREVNLTQRVFDLPQQRREQEIVASGQFDVEHLAGTNGSWFVCARRH